MPRQGKGLPPCPRTSVLAPPALYVDHIAGTGIDLFNAACGHDLEGIVPKLAAGTYDPDATTWVKIKNRAYSQMKVAGNCSSGSGLDRPSARVLLVEG